MDCLTETRLPGRREKPCSGAFEFSRRSGCHSRDIIGNIQAVSNLSTVGWLEKDGKIGLATGFSRLDLTNSLQRGV